MLKKLNHVAIAVQDAQKAAEQFAKQFQMKAGPVQELPEHGVTVAFIDCGNMKVEFISPFGDNSPIEKFVEKNPNGAMHHLCFEVEDVSKSLCEIKENSGQADMFDKVQVKIGAHDKKVIFLPPKSCCGVLVELENESKG